MALKGASDWWVTSTPCISRLFLATEAEAYPSTSPNQARQGLSARLTVLLPDYGLAVLLHRIYVSVQN